MNALCTMKKCIKSTLRMATSFLGLQYIYFFNIQGIYRGKGDRSSLDWGGFMAFSLNCGGVIKRLTKRLQKIYFHNFSVGWGLNPIFTRLRGAFKTLVIIHMLLGGFLLIFLAESEKVAFLVTDINDFVIFVIFSISWYSR